MEYKDLNASICVIFAFQSQKEFDDFQKNVVDLQKETLDCFNDELQGHFINFKFPKKNKSQKTISDYSLSDYDIESSLEDDIDILNPEELKIFKNNFNNEQKENDSFSNFNSKNNDFEFFESKELNNIDENSNKKEQKEIHDKSKLKKRESNLSQQSWTQLAHIKASEENNASNEKEELVSFALMKYTPNLSFPQIINFENLQKQNSLKMLNLISLPKDKIEKKQNSSETPEGSSQANNSIKEICAIEMSIPNSHLDSIKEDKNSSYTDSFPKRGRLNSCQFEPIDRGSFNSTEHSNFSNNTESFRKYSESNGYESFEGSKPRKNSQKSGIDGEFSIMEDDWMKVGTINSSGKYNTANSNQEMEIVESFNSRRKLTRDFSKRNLQNQQKLTKEIDKKGGIKQLYHSSKNSINLEYAPKFNLNRSNLRKKLTKTYSSNTKFSHPIQTSNSGASLLKKKSPIKAVDSYELLYQSLSKDSLSIMEAGCQELIDSYSKPNLGHKRVNSIGFDQNQELSKNRSGYNFTFTILKDPSETKNVSILELPAMSVERKKTLKKTHKVIKAQ